MRYRYRFNVSTLWKKRKEIYEFLNKNNIEYEMWGFDKYGKFGDYEFVKFSLFSTSEDTPRLLKELENLIPFGPMIFPEFTKKEFEQANYLVMRPKRQCIQIKNEEDALTEELEAVFDMGAEDFQATQEIMDQVMELRDCDEEEAEAFVALGIYLGVTFGDLNDTFESCGDCRYEAAGDEYYVGTEDQLESIARDIVRSDDYEYLWRECVRAEKTLDGFYEWGDEVIKNDGWVSILNHYDGCCYSQYNINGTYICVSRT